MINPLFLDELREEYQHIKDDVDRQHRLLAVGSISHKEVDHIHEKAIKRCNKLLERMSKMKFFDPLVVAATSLSSLIKCFGCLKWMFSN